MFKVIIWATDGSSGAEQALPYAKGLAQADGARLIVVHVNEFWLAGPADIRSMSTRTRSRPRSGSRSRT